MTYLSKLKAITLAVLFFFLASILLPYPAMAFHVTAWGAGSQPIGSTSPSKSPGAGTNGPEKNTPPVNNPCSTAKPVYLNSGEEHYECVDLVIPGRGMDLVLKHLYRSGKQYNGQFGYGWMFNYYYRLQALSNGNVTIVSGDGRNDTYTFNSTTGTYTAPLGLFQTLVANTDGTWVLTGPDAKKLQFDINGLLTAVTDRNGNQITLTYNPAGVQAILGQPSFALGGLSVPTQVVAYDYQLTRITDTLGRAVDFTYDAKGHLVAITDYAGRTVTFTYDNLTNNLVSITKPASAEFPSGLTKSFVYDAGHRLLSITDPKGQTFVTNTYDTQGRVSQQNLGAGNYLFSYGLNLTTVTDRKGFVQRYTFNATGNVTVKEEFTAGVRPGDPGSFITRYVYNTDMLMTSVTYPKGNGVKYVYDSANPNTRARGNLLSVREKTNMAVADNNTNDLVTTITYEPQFNFPKTVTDPKGNVTQLTYDYELPLSDPRYATKGNLVKVVRPAVGGVSPQINITYNAFGQPVAITDANGKVTAYGYHTATGYLASVTRDPSGLNAVTQFTYDTFGNVDTVTDADGRVSDLDYNELGWLTRAVNPVGFAARYTHDENGNVTKVERQANATATQWQTVVMAYDILNNLTSVTDPLNRVTTYNYDNNENLVSVTDALNNTTNYVYDERDRLYTTTDANLSITRQDYDQNGNLSKIIDANNNLTTYTYDLFDRLLTKIYADASVETYTYDKNNNRTQVKRPDLSVINFAYDALDRLTAETYPANTSLNTAYTYDVGSRLLTANTAASNISYVYDALNRVTATTQYLSPNTYTLNYQYDLAGNQTRVTYPSGKVVDYTYDNNDRMTGINVDSAALAAYTYDTLDRRATKTFSTTGPQQQTTYSFDPANQLLSLTNTVLPSTAVSAYNYTYDNAGNRLSMTAPSGTHNYAYNNIYELTGVSGAQTHTFAYDAVGNRTIADGASYVHNTLNQYNQVGSTPISHSVNGNLTDDGVNDYTYDIQNRLSSIVNGLSSASYTYDAFNRRVSKTVNGVVKYFVYDGDDIIAEYNSAGTLLAEYVHGNSTDEVLTMSRSGQTYYYHHDGLGSVTEITDGTGAVVESYTYDVYGQPSVTTSLIGNPYRFTGREFDEESGIYHYRARAYSPSLGRFLQRDPIGYFDSMNLYSYANNNPINWTDPFGLCKLPGGSGSGGSTIWEIIKDNFFETLENMPQIFWEDVKEIYNWPQENFDEVITIILFGNFSALPKLRPNFIVGSNGTVYPVPKGAVGPVPVRNNAGKLNGYGFINGQGGANGKVSTMRIMNPTPARGGSPGYPKGNIKYENKSGQGVNPYTGRTGSKKETHFSLGR